MTLGNKASERLETGLTFDDVLLVPRRSSIRSRQDVSLKTRLTTNIEIDLPILAANMDTVCEQEMAITMASLGGVGILHRFMTVEAQAQMVENIKNENSSYVAGAAIGTDHDALVRSKALIDAGVDVLVLDIAHGHAEHAIDALKEFGFVKGLFMSVKRILSCHPIKFLGGGEGFDPVKKEMKIKK
mgnify:CR=1 FL=1